MRCQAWRSLSRFFSPTRMFIYFLKWKRPSCVCMLLSSFITDTYRSRCRWWRSTNQSIELFPCWASDTDNHVPSVNLKKEDREKYKLSRSIKSWKPIHQCTQAQRPSSCCRQLSSLRKQQSTYSQNANEIEQQQQQQPWLATCHLIHGEWTDLVKSISALSAVGRGLVFLEHFVFGGADESQHRGRPQTARFVVKIELRCVRELDQEALGDASRHELNFGDRRAPVDGLQADRFWVGHWGQEEISSRNRGVCIFSLWLRGFK